MSESTMSKIIDALINPNLFEDTGYAQSLVSYVKDFRSGKMTETELRLHIHLLMDAVNYNGGFDD